jgi:hypothetical protein
MLENDLTWGKLDAEEKSNSTVTTAIEVSTMDDKELYLNVCEALRANASKMTKKHDKVANTEAIKALVEIVNRKFNKDWTDITEAIRYLAQDQPANLLQGEEEEKDYKDEDCVLQVESSSKSSSTSNNSNSSDDSVSSLDDSDDSSENKDGSKEEEDEVGEVNLSEAEESEEEKQGDKAAKTAEDASKIDKEGEVEVASPDDEAKRTERLKEEDDKDKEEEEGNKTPGGKETLGKGARKTASAKVDRLEEEENEWGEQGDRAAKTAEVSYKEEGGGGGNTRTKLASDEREHVGDQQKESSKGMQLRKKNKGLKNI